MFFYYRNNSFHTLRIIVNLLTLRFYATESFYITVADFMMTHKSIAARLINKVTTAIVNLSQTFISIFYEIARFPMVLGAVDGTYIRIQSLGA